MAVAVADDALEGKGVENPDPVNGDGAKDLQSLTLERRLLEASGDTNSANADASEFVTRLFQLVLGRAPDASGLNAHVSALMGGSSASTIAWGFFGSSEFANRRLTNAQRVEIAYNTMLDRGPDGLGLFDWTNKLDAGMSMRAIVAGFSGSAEFRNLCALGSEPWQPLGRGEP